MTDAALEQRLHDLVARLSLPQKVRLLTGADFWALYAEPAAGLRRVVTSDGPAGVRGELWDERDPSVNIPSPTAVAASWDPELVTQLGRLLASEARRKGVDVVLAPTVNLHRSPFGGRHFECFSEDPLLTGDVGVALVAGLQSQGVAATVKHFVANDSETDRLTVDVDVDERTLREVYLAPFEAIVRAGAWAVMAAYNRVGGTTMTESPLLRSVLHDEWGFDGVTMTDWYAGRSVEAAAESGLDLMMPGPTGPWVDGLVPAVESGRVPGSVVDEKVIRLLRLAARVGALEGVSTGQSAETPSAEEATSLVRRAAAAGFVLLSNNQVGDIPVLPLRWERLRSVAVIGPNAQTARFLGGGSALVFPPYTVSPVAGLAAALPGIEVAHCEGVRADERLRPADPRLLHTPEGEPGVTVEFRDADGIVLGRDRRLGTAFNWNNAFGDGVDPGRVGEVELQTVLTTERAGQYRIGAAGTGRFRLRLDGHTHFDELLELPEGADPVEGLMRPPQEWDTVELAAGQTVEISLTHVVKERAPGDDTLVSLQLNVDLSTEPDDELERAVELARRCDVAVVVVGTTEEVESEGFDRDSLALPGRQDELVRRIAEVRPETVVVVNAGAPVLMPWRHEVAATMLAWFPGQEFGNALADVLLGDLEPGGHLPTTWPASESDPLPSTRPSSGRLAYDEGLHVGYRRYLRAGVEPAYWFGHGLGYTSWTYDSVSADAAGRTVRVAVELTNTGARAGRQLVQVYLSRPDSALERPVRWLAGHALVTAERGDTVTATVELSERAFAHWGAEGWAVEDGVFQVQVGTSAGEILLRTNVVR